MGYGSGLVAVALYSMLVFFNFPILLYPMIIIPIFISVNGLNEAKYQFCTGYGRSGKYNINNEVGMTLDVLSKTKRDADRKFANALLLKSLKTSLLISILLIALSRILN